MSTPFEIEKQERETNQGLIRRFSKRLKSSGIINQAKQSVFHERDKSEQTKKKAALRRIQKRAEREKMKKMGK